MSQENNPPDQDVNLMRERHKLLESLLSEGGESTDVEKEERHGCPTKISLSG